jgi:hypothetical protein
MEKQTKEDIDHIKTYLMSSRDFYKRILLEEYKTKHPNGFRYKDAEEQVSKINVKGKLLKTILDKK